jgi:predicted transcriptional regulator
MITNSQSQCSEAPIDKMIRLHKEGKTYDEIAKECKVCKQTVRNHISEYTGIPRRP